MTVKTVAKVSPDFRESFGKSAPCAPTKCLISKFTSRMVLDRLSNKLKEEPAFGSLRVDPEMVSTKLLIAREASSGICNYIMTLQLTEKQRELLPLLRYELQRTISSALVVMADKSAKNIIVQQGMVFVPLKVARGKETLVTEDNSSLFPDWDLSPALDKTCAYGAVSAGIGTFAGLMISFWGSFNAVGVLFYALGATLTGALGAILAGTIYCTWASIRDKYRSIVDPPAMANALDAAIKNLFWPKEA